MNNITYLDFDLLIQRVEEGYRAQVLNSPAGQASVTFEVTVDESGNVISARSISGHPLLKDAAEAAARGWQFSPTYLSGLPVKVIGTISFNFSL